MSNLPGRLMWLVAGLAVVAACGGSSAGSAPSGPSGATPTGGTQALVITITASGVSPKNVTIPAGTQVTFVNKDSIDHLMFSNPHPEHTDCPPINQVGYLAPGDSRQTGNMNIVQTCGFHDHDLPLDSSLQGTITTQ